MCEPSLFFDEALHVHFFFSAVVVGHAFTCTTVLPISAKKWIGIQEKSWSTHTKVPSQKLFLGIPSDFPDAIGRTEVGVIMSLHKEFIRDGKRRIIGSVTSGYSDESAIVRDEDNKLAGRTSERYDTTRDDHGNLVSINSPDPGLLLGRKK